MLATFEYTKVECTKVECTCMIRGQAFECLQRSQCMKVECTYIYTSCSSVSSIRMLATFEYTKVECTKVEYTKVECTKVECMKVECTYIYKLRDSRVSQTFERSQRSNARVFTSRVILEYLNVSISMYVYKVYVRTSI